MITDGIEKVWTAAATVAESITPHADEVVRQFNHREATYVRYMDTVDQVDTAMRPIAPPRPGEPAQKWRDKREAGKATVQASQTAREALAQYAAAHGQLNTVSATLTRTRDSVLQPALHPVVRSDEEQTESLTRLAYQYWQTDRPAAAARLTAEDYVDLGDRLADQMNERLSDERGDLNDWLNSDDQRDRPEISSLEVRESDVLRQLVEDYPPEDPDRPTAIDRYLAATELADAVRRASSWYGADGNLERDQMSLETIESLAQTVVDKPRAATAEVGDKIRDEHANLGGQDPRDEYYTAGDEQAVRLAAACQDVMSTAAASERPTDPDGPALRAAQTLRSMSFPQNATEALRDGTKSPTTSLDSITAVRASRTAARAAEQAANAARLSELDLPF